MKKDATEPLSSPIPAAQYVRMSDEAQQYSIENQKAAIQKYGAHRGFAVVKTYADAGKSGVIAKNRTALRELLKEVFGGRHGEKQGAAQENLSLVEVILKCAPLRATSSALGR